MERRLREEAEKKAHEEQEGGEPTGDVNTASTADIDMDEDDEDEAPRKRCSSRLAAKTANEENASDMDEETGSDYDSDASDAGEE